jgi:sarcosine oxidase subunit beta
MTSKPSVVVIGAGALGLCTAYYLTQKGLSDVTVLERDHPASASSGLSVGIIETQYLDPLAIEIRVVSMRFFAELEQAGVLDVRHNGYLRLGHSDEDLSTFARSVEVQREYGLNDSCVLDPAGLKRIIPHMFCDDLTGGLFGPTDGYIDGHLYCNALVEAVTAGGGRVLSTTALTGVDAGRSHAHLLKTTRGDFECDVVVNAAGAWAGQVGDMLGAPVTILPQRHRALMARLPSALDYVMPSVMDYLPSSGGYGLYFRDEGPARLIAGLHTEEPIHDLVDPDDYTRGGDQEYIALVAERLARRLPSLGGVQLGDVWAGLYPISPDGMPKVGPHPGRESVVTVAGAGGSGLQSSPALGLLAAEWIVDGRPRTIPSAQVLQPGSSASVQAANDLTSRAGFSRPQRSQE